MPLEVMNLGLVETAITAEAIRAVLKVGAACMVTPPETAGNRDLGLTVMHLAVIRVVWKARVAPLGIHPEIMNLGVGPRRARSVASFNRLPSAEAC